MISVSELRGVGKSREKLLAKLRIADVQGLANHFPRAYQDRTKVRDIKETVNGEFCTIIAHCTTTPSAATLRGGLNLVKFKVSDGTASLAITFFNQLWIKDKFDKGKEYMFYGKIEGESGALRMTSPAFEEILPNTAPRIIPIYRTTAGLSQNMLSKIIQNVFEDELYTFSEVIPASIREKYRLSGIETAMREIHRPMDEEMLKAAKRRLVFEELMILQLGLALMKGRSRKETSVRIAPCNMNEFYNVLPFELTGAQRRVIEEGISDFEKVVPMSRLVQGDVGSGKTAIGAALAFAAFKSGYQSAFMAPTEILAVQHADTLGKLLTPLGMKVGLLTGSLSAKEKKAVHEALALGEIDLAVGTHALISERVEYLNLGLVITDEQHRFGVNQRTALSNKGQCAHTLVMSATPIPRTLALIIYGDLDVSVVDELPRGRQKIDTVAVGEDKRERVNAFIKKILGEGRQAFIVCPLVEASDLAGDNLKDVQSYAESLKGILAPFKVEFLHGKLKPKDKERIMGAFLKREFDALVSTTVVEVGVDVPNATLMIIENAERFGLSQLHQLRGRVGRGQHKSYCIMIAHGAGEDARSRLETMVRITDGFKIAERDLEIRGPGEFFGERQHGLPELKIADMSNDMEVLREAGEAVKDICESGLERDEFAPLMAKIQTMFERGD